MLFHLKDYYGRRGDARNHAGALHQWGNMAEGWRQVDEAERWYRQSLAITDRLSNAYGQGITLHPLGMIAEARGEAACRCDAVSEVVGGVAVDGLDHHGNKRGLGQWSRRRA